MSYRLEREKTTSTPYVLIDEEEGRIRLEGRCFHENAAEFFREIDEWLEDYLKTDFGTLTFECAITYFNSSTTKLLLNMLIKLDRQASDRNRIIVNWITSGDNEIMIECGEDFQEDLENLEFNLIVAE